MFTLPLSAEFGRSQYLFFTRHPSGEPIQDARTRFPANARLTFQSDCTLRSNPPQCAVYDDVGRSLTRRRQTALDMNARYRVALPTKPRIAGFQA